MRAAGIRQFGANVELLELPAPDSPAADEVLIRVVAAGVGNWDELVRQGSWDVGAQPPAALGVEAAGIIDLVGRAVMGFEPGDRVLTHPLPLLGQGTWAEFLLARATLVARAPAALDWPTAAVLPVPGLTADQAIRDALRVRADDVVLVHGAGGVTGSLAAQLAQRAGARVIVTAGPSSVDYARGLGIDAVLDGHDPVWPQQARALTDGTGVHAALNAVRGAEAATLAAVQDGGRFCTITGQPPLEERGVSIVNLYVAPDGPRLANVAELTAQGQFRPRMGLRLPLERAAEALSMAASGRGGGAVALVIDAEAVL
jgi:NADPH:quinone reductase-like Zn-dependent oxidoreductase